MSIDNLNRHKGLINKFLTLVNKQRDQAYLQESLLEMQKKETRLFVYEFDTIKIDKVIKVIKLIIIGKIEGFIFSGHSG